MRGVCEGQSATFFVDTGSAVSLISKHFIDHYGSVKRTKPTSLRLKSFTADNIKTYGEIHLRVVIAKQTTTHRFVVTDLADTHCLLGLDFLQASNVNINVTIQALQSSRGSSPFLKERKQLQEVLAVRSKETVVLPPNTAVFLRAKIAGVNDNHCYTGFIEPKLSLLASSELMVESSLTHTDGKDLPVKVVNLSDKPAVLYKNKVLGSIYPVNSNCDTNIRRVVVDIETTVPEWRRNGVNEITIDGKI